MTSYTRTRHNSAGASTCTCVILAAITIGILYAVLLVAPSGAGFLTSGGQTKNSMHLDSENKRELAQQAPTDDIALIVFRETAKSRTEVHNKKHVEKRDEIIRFGRGSGTVVREGEKSTVRATESTHLNPVETRHLGLGRDSAPPYSSADLGGNGISQQGKVGNSTIILGGPHNKVLPVRLEGLRDLVFSDELVDFDFVGIERENEHKRTLHDGTVREQTTPTGQEHSIRRGLHLREYGGIPVIISNLSVTTDALDDSEKGPVNGSLSSFSLAASAVVGTSKSRQTRRPPLSHVVAMVITDGKFEDRIDGLLGTIKKNRSGRKEVDKKNGKEKTHPSRTDKKVNEEGDFNREIESGWLRGTFHTFLMFDLQQSKSWEVFKHRYDAASIRDARGDFAFGGTSLPPPLSPLPLVDQPRTKRRHIGVSKEDFAALLDSNRNEGEEREREEKSDDRNRSIDNADSVLDDDQLVSPERNFHSQIGIEVPLPPQRHQEGQIEAEAKKKKFTFSHSLLSRSYTTEFISAAPTHRKPPNAAWKPWSVVLFMARRGTQRFLAEKAELYEANKEDKEAILVEATTTPKPKPLWFAILDDDTFAFSYSLAYSLEPLTRELDLHYRTELALVHDKRTSARSKESDAALNESEPSLAPFPPPLFIYAGHVIDYCPRVPCNPKKRFSFAFGGSGIFLSRDAVLALASPDVVGECRNVFMMIAGDEQLGGCIAKSQKIRQLHTENLKAKEFSLNEKILLSGLHSTSQAVRHVMGDYRRERKHYGFVASDVFRGAAYDVPATAIGHYYLHQKKPEKTAGKDHQAATATFITASIASEESNAMPPFPVSFHHVKNPNETKLLAAVEKAWETVVWETFSGNGGKGENAQLPEGWTPYESQSARNTIPSITPWPFIAAILLADEELLNVSLTLAWPSSGSSTNHHGLPLHAQTASVSAASMQMLRSLMDFADKNRYFTAYNRRERLFPYYVVPELVQQRLEAEAAARRSSSKKKGRRR